MKRQIKHIEVKNKKIKEIGMYAEQLRLNNEEFDVGKIFDNIEHMDEYSPPDPVHMEKLSSKESSEEDIEFEKIGSSMIKKSYSREIGALADFMDTDRYNWHEVDKKLTFEYL